MIALYNDTLVYLNTCAHTQTHTHTHTPRSHTPPCIFFPPYVTVQVVEGANSLKTTGKLHFRFINSIVIWITADWRQRLGCSPKDGKIQTECKDNDFFHSLTVTQVASQLTRQIGSLNKVALEPYMVISFLMVYSQRCLQIIQQSVNVSGEEMYTEQAACGRLTALSFEVEQWLCVCNVCSLFLFKKVHMTAHSPTLTHTHTHTHTHSFHPLHQQTCTQI